MSLGAKLPQAEFNLIMVLQYHIMQGWVARQGCLKTYPRA